MKVNKIEVLFRHIEHPILSLLEEEVLMEQTIMTSRNDKVYLNEVIYINTHIYKCKYLYKNILSKHKHMEY